MVFIIAIAEPVGAEVGVSQHAGLSPEDGDVVGARHYAISFFDGRELKIAVCVGEGVFAGVFGRGVGFASGDADAAFGGLAVDEEAAFDGRDLSPNGVRFDPVVDDAKDAIGPSVVKAQFSRIFPLIFNCFVESRCLDVQAVRRRIGNHVSES